MSLIVFKDFTQRIADDILRGADTEEIALQKAEQIQEEIEEELKSRTEEIQAVIKDKREENALRYRKMKRRADRKDRAIYKIKSRDSTNPEEVIRIIVANPYTISRNDLESLSDVEINLDSPADALDTDDELEYKTDDEDYLDQYTISIDGRKAPFIGATDVDIINQLKKLSHELTYDEFTTFANKIKNSGCIRYKWSREWIEATIDLMDHYITETY